MVFEACFAIGCDGGADRHQFGDWRSVDLLRVFAGSARRSLPLSRGDLETGHVVSCLRSRGQILNDLTEHRIVPIHHRIDIAGLGRQPNVDQSRGLGHGARFIGQHRSRQAADERLDHVQEFLGKGFEQGQIGDGNPPARLQHAGDFPPDLRLVRREVQDAVGDHHIHAVVRSGQVLDLAQAELHVVEPRVLLICGDALASLAHHVWGHIDADDAPARPYLWARDEDVETPAAAQVQDYFARSERGDRRRIPAGKAHVGSFRQHRQVDFAVPYAASQLLGGSGTAARRRTARPSRSGDLAVPFANRFSNLLFLIPTAILSHCHTPFLDTSSTHDLTCRST